MTRKGSNPMGETGLTIGQVIAALPDDVRAALEEIKRRRGDRTLADALLATVYREQSLDHLRDQGWQLLVEKDGDVRELAEV